ncbi:MAG: hypothetical protein UT32_C0002G0063 [Parcubacteria group bacterium GW2011_GWC2_39_14]|nr:MAG: hypothetical protein UT32_C0002G0063 [Parcubacteria group bacterium GW2011_GWC2_39_14]KKR55288.1 MAG: hypothetical protein UT91_C0003G0063 [Parcubacteria group bacterium GW2011_GWA2_40_23]
MIWIYSLVSILAVSLISFLGVLFLGIKKEKLEHILLYFVSFSIGALFAEVFIHIIPRIVEEVGFTVRYGLYFLLGLIVFFIVEKYVHWHHCHKVDHHHEIKPVAYTNLIGDGLHNFLDGLIIASSFVVSVPLGIATAFAVLFHEIPQEIGDFGVLLYSGLSKKKALWLNFGSALLAVVGGVVGILLASTVSSIEMVILAIAGGGFVYIAGSDLIPELHQNKCSRCSSVYQLLFMILGIVVMMGLLLLE